MTTLGWSKISEVEFNGPVSYPTGGFHVTTDLNDARTALLGIKSIGAGIASVTWAVTIEPYGAHVMFYQVGVTGQLGVLAEIPNGTDLSGTVYRLVVFGD